MKMILNTVSLLLSVFIFGQKYHIVYKVDFKPQTDKSNLKTEYLALNTDGNRSIFYNLDYKKSDSISAETRKKSDAQYLKFTIKQNAKAYSYYGNFNNFLFTYTEDLPSIWKINNKTYSYKNYKVQEAEIEFEGRKWIAVFCPEIPISNGPYKFSNLPGLILKVYSTDGDYNFEMVEIMSRQENQFHQIVGNYNSVKKNRIDKMIADFVKDPAAKNITVVNEYEDSYDYKFSGKRDQAYNDMRTYIEGVIAKFNNPPDKKTYILVF